MKTKITKGKTINHDNSGMGGVGDDEFTDGVGIGEVVGSVVGLAVGFVVG